MVIGIFELHLHIGYAPGKLIVAFENLAHNGSQVSHGTVCFLDG